MSSRRQNKSDEWTTAARIENLEAPLGHKTITVHTRMDVIVRRYTNLVASQCWKRLRSREDVEDVIQIAFTKVFVHFVEKGAESVAESRLPRFLVVVTSRSVTDYLRHLGGRKGNRPSTIDFSNHQRGSDAEDGQSLAENLSWRGDDEAIQGELLELLTKRAGSQVARAAKLFWDGYTTREIAVRIGVSVRNISKKLEQAKMVIIEAGYSI